MPLANNFQTTIEVGATTSTPITKGAKVFTKMFVENFSSATVLFFEVSRDGITYRNLQTYSPQAATPLLTNSITPGTSNFMVAFEPWLLQDVNFVRFTANATIATTACTISLY